MIGKKINQLATELAPASTDLTIIGDPISGVSKKITIAQLGAIFSGAVSFYDNFAAFPATGDINVIYCAKDTKKLYLWSGSAYVEVFPSQALLDTYQLRSEKGNANGYASLDSGGKVPISQLPSSIMEYKGTWNAATNTPTLANGTGDTGDVYICNVAGTVNFGAGPLTFAVGDYVIYSGSIWQRSSGAVGTVTSVAVSRSGDALAITGSPITTSGTINIGFAGNSTQYINGAGNLVTFPGIINEAQNLITEVYNSTGATLTKGTIVYINGGQGNLPTVTKALATGDSTSAQTYGIVRNDITNNNNGYVVVAGRISDLDTQAYTEGTQLYLSPTTAGTFTSTKPYAPQHLVYVGIVVRAHPTQGVVEVKIQNGYELDELHNVAAQSPDNNDILQYKTATSLWTKVAGTTSNIAEGSNLYYTDARSRAAISLTTTGTSGASTYNNTTGVLNIPQYQTALTNPVTGTGTTNYIAKFTGTSTIGNSLVFDNGTNVGIGTITPGEKLVVSDGTVNWYVNPNAANSSAFIGTSTNHALSFVTNGNERVRITNAGQVGIGTTNPSDKLTVTDTFFTFNIGAAPAGAGTLLYSLGSGGITFSTNTKASERMTITNGGNVGIGTNNPTFLLDVSGTLRATGAATFSNLAGTGTRMVVADANGLLSTQAIGSGAITGSGTTNYIPKFTGTSTIGNSQIFDNGTNVGIGTTSPANTLDVQTSSGVGSSTASGLARFITAGTTPAISVGQANSARKLDLYSYLISVTGEDLWLQTSQAYPIVLSTNNTERMRITSGGTLAIATSSPIGGVFKLQVGDGSADSRAVIVSNQVYQLGFRNGASSPLFYEGSDTSGNKIFSNNAGSELMRITSGGNVLVNTTTDNGQKMQIIGGASTALRLDANSGVAALNIGAGATLLVDAPGVGGGRFTITSGGNVGIGTSSPSNLLGLQSPSANARVLNIYNGLSGAGDYVSIGSQFATNNANVNSEIRFGNELANNAPSYLAFATGTGSSPTERLRITSGGALYLGATSGPSGATGGLDAGAMYINSNLYIGNTAGTTGYAFRWDGYANALYGIWSNASGADQGGLYLSYAATSWTANSDERLKNINSNIGNAVDKLKTLRAINYSWKSDETQKQNLGLIAQDVEKVFPQVIDKNRNGYLGVRYSELVPVLVAAIQELKAELDTFKNK